MNCPSSKSGIAGSQATIGEIIEQSLAATEDRSVIKGESML